VAEQFRLVLYAAGNGDTPTGGLYPIDSGPYANPAWIFDLEPDQQLPRLQPGDLVDVEGVAAQGAHPTIVAGDTVVTPGGRGLRRGADSMRVFAERGGVLAHPAMVGWARSWRFTRSESFHTPEVWAKRVRQVQVEWLGYLLLLIVVIGGLITVWIVRGRAPHFTYLGYGTGISVSAFVANRRAARALRRARDVRSQPATEMWMELHYTAGAELGPVAVATLFDDATGRDPISYVSVVNLPNRFDPPGRLKVAVRGGARAFPVISGDGFELWPLERAHIEPHSPHRVRHERA
jgi:hypothetical protein